MPLQLVILSRPFGWSALTQWPLLFQQQPHLQHQQIRSFFRRKTKKKRTNEKPRQRRSMMQRWNAKYRFFQANNELRMIPVRFRTHIGRVLNKATRGEHQTEWLIHFVEEYMSYSVELRKTGIIPYIRENYHRVAFENFFLRILRLITFDNNGSGMNGFNFVIQFYADLLKVIYDKAAELKSLDSKVNLMRLRLSHFDKLKRVIRKEMAQYILKDFSSKPFPIAIPDRRRDSFIPKLITNNARKDTTTKLGRTHPINAVTTVEPNALDNETETTNNPCGEISPFVLGSIRRVYYKDLTARFIAKCERRPNGSMYGARCYGVYIIARKNSDINRRNFCRRKKYGIIRKIESSNLLWHIGDEQSVSKDWTWRIYDTSNHTAIIRRSRNSIVGQSVFNFATSAQLP